MKDGKEKSCHSERKLPCGWLKFYLERISSFHFLENVNFTIFFLKARQFRDILEFYFLEIQMFSLTNDIVSLLK